MVGNGPAGGSWSFCWHDRRGLPDLCLNKQTNKPKKEKKKKFSERGAAAAKEKDNFLPQLVTGPGIKALCLNLLSPVFFYLKLIKLLK